MQISKKTSAVFVLLIISFGCFVAWDNGGRISNAVTSDTLLQKKIVFPDELRPITPAAITSMTNFRSYTDGKEKIVSIIDGTCASCIIDQLNLIDKTFQDINETGSAVMVFIVNVTKNDSAYFVLNMQPLIKAKGLVLIDHSYNFEKRNKLFTSDGNLRTFLISEEGKILTYGNPLINRNLLSNYKTMLQ
jgi:hypothetical protein